MNTNLIKDPATRKAIDEINKKLESDKNIRQLPSSATLAEVIDVINKLTGSLKR